MRTTSALLLIILLFSSSAFPSVQDSAYTSDSDSLQPFDSSESSDSLSSSDIRSPFRTDQMRTSVIGRFAVIGEISSEDIDNSISESVGDLLDMWSLTDIARVGSMGQREAATVAGYPQSLEIFVDGVPFRQQDIFFPQKGNLDLNSVFLSNVSSMRLLPAGLAGMWGTGGGILGLGVDTKNLRGDEPYSRATAGRGPYGSHRTQVELGRRLTSKGNFYFTAEFEESDGYEANSDYDGTSLWGKVAYDLTSKADLKLSGYRYRTKMGIPFLQDADYQDSRKKIDNWGIGSSLLIRENLHAHLNLNLRYEKQNQEVKSEGYGFEVRYNDERLALTATQTFERQRSRIEVEGYTAREVFSTLTTKETVHGGHLSVADVYQLGPALKLLLSSKIAKEEGQNAGISALTGISYLPSRRLVLFGTLGTFAGCPNTTDLYLPAFSFGSQDNPADYLEEGDDLLKSQRSYIADLGVNLKGKDFQTSGYVFGSVIDDMLLWSDVDTTLRYGHFKPINTQAEVWGASLNCRLRFLNYLSSYLSYGYKRGEDSDRNLRLPCSPEHSLFGYVQFENEYLKREIDLKLRLEGKLWSERFMDEYEQDREPAAAVLNVKLTIRFLDFHFHYTVRNVTDESYRLLDAYTMPGRTQWWGFYWEFYD